MKVGVALGSGSARGWAHIGVLRALAEIGIRPDVVCGTSIGAFVGATYADGHIEQLDEWVRSLSWQKVVRFFDVGARGGLLKGDKLMHFFAHHFVDRAIEDLPLPFACVATNLLNGHEVWLKEGSVAAAVRASIALPGLFVPQPHDGRLLVDGGLVNPVPVSLCRALGADIVIAVDVDTDLVGQRFRMPPALPVPPTAWQRLGQWLGRGNSEMPPRNGGHGENGEKIGGGNGNGSDIVSGSANGSCAVNGTGVPGLGGLGNSRPASNGSANAPSLLDVVAGSINIMQVRIARSRLAGEPADVLIAPRVAEIGLFDYHRGAEAIAEGREAVRVMQPAIVRALNE